MNALSADFEDNLGEEELIDPSQISRAKPFSIIGEYDWIGKSHFSDAPFQNNEIDFNQGTLSFRSVVWYNERCREGVLGEIGYSSTHIGWDNNPFFNEHHFNTANVGFTLFTERMCNWLWTFRFVAGFDVDSHAPSDSTAYDTLLWGRYNISPRWGVHFGFLAQTGMRIDHVYPIIGFDWKPNAKWEVDVVYPVNIAVVYNINCNWAFAMAARFWDSRFRLNEDQPISEGLLVYRNSGIEVETRYHYNDWISAQLHAGYTLGGQLKVANRQYEDKMHFDFDSGPYIGGDFTISF